MDYQNSAKFFVCFSPSKNIYLIAVLQSFHFDGLNRFEILMPLYSANYRCILIDFLGNGQSDRIKKFSADMWYKQVIRKIIIKRPSVKAISYYRMN